MTSYSIDKPSSDNSYFTVFLKYTTLLIVAWIAGWFILLFYVAKFRVKYIEDAILDNGAWVSLAVAISVVIFFARRTFAKYRYGSAFVFSFNDELETLTIRLTNTLNDKEREVQVPYQRLFVLVSGADSRLFGKQRIYSFYDDQIPVTSVNIDLTAWCRLENLPELLNRFGTFVKDKNTLQPV
jgi:hypothetical protein